MKVTSGKNITCPKVEDAAVIFWLTFMQYIALFHGCKNDNFQVKIVIIFLFLLKT